MRYIQGAFLTGYVTVLVKGNHPEMFFQACINQGISVWDVKKIDDQACQGNIRLKDISFIKKIRRDMKYKLSFIRKKGYPFLFKRFTRKKEAVFALITSILLVLFLSNIIWDVKISGVSTDVEEKINKALIKYDIRPGKWAFSIESPSIIQQNLVKDVPELLWVGVHKKGTTFVLEGVEKVIVDQEESPGPRHLVATKNGVIEKLYVSKGLPQVNVNDYVLAGDVLVSGDIVDSDEDEENDQKKNSDVVAAEAEIRARTWYETSVTVPLEANYELLTGNREKKYFVSLGKVQLPIWGFGQPDYKDMDIERDEHSLYFFKWELPMKIVESTLSEKVYNKTERTKEEAIRAGIVQAKQELQLQLGPQAEIISEKVLHETIENGKVKLNLFITVVEDITREEPITQGD